MLECQYHKQETITIRVKEQQITAVEKLVYTTIKLLVH